MDRLTPLDASFLTIEDEVNHLQVASVALFEGPAPAFPDLRRLVQGRLPLVPRYRQRVRQLPLQLGRPVWIDDPHFRIDYHLRHTSLPSPGSAEQLRTLVGRIMSQQLDRAKPLWEMWVVEGLADGDWALISKVHQCLVDGVVGTDLLSVMLDDRPEPSTAVPDRWMAEAEPSDARLVAEALLDYVADPYEQWRMVRSVLGAPRRAVAGAFGVARGAASVLGVLQRTPTSSLAGPIGPHRRWAYVQASLADVRQIRSIHGGSVNDVLLAAVAGGFRRLLVVSGEPPERRRIRALVPVSVRREGQLGPYRNLIAPSFVDLPVGIADPVERLAAVGRQTHAGMPSAVAAASLTSMTNFAPPLLLALGTRLAVRAARRLGGQAGVHTIVTNVPGPQRPRYAFGRRMLATYPYSPLVSPARVGVSIFSYDGCLSFGITADYDSITEVDAMCDGIVAGVADLLAAGARAPAGGVSSPTR